ncbi:LOB domain-containing protein 1 isoform X2 [Ricinus communis]|uniref:LOB domain-containing protein 1 isoform X2 n=1 Tax=Ricinus communis TaxID=3988 RepID=UPI00201AEEFA|nr:LOB domain-containing protein 1 isoform X2 [Ricinus communis]
MGNNRDFNPFLFPSTNSKSNPPSSPSSPSSSESFPSITSPLQSPPSLLLAPDSQCSSTPLPPPTADAGPPLPPLLRAAVVRPPCDACKLLRRRCTEKCLFAPFFPPNGPFNFSTVHRVFGASNINKLLQQLPESQRADAINSMVYEANARIRDPIYGSAGEIRRLKEQVKELQARIGEEVSENESNSRSNFH